MGKRYLSSQYETLNRSILVNNLFLSLLKAQILPSHLNENEETQDIVVL